VLYLKANQDPAEKQTSKKKAKRKGWKDKQAQSSFRGNLTILLPLRHDQFFVSKFENIKE
jgi:hypothetical protein